MFIFALLVGKKPEQNKPIFSLAELSYAIVTAFNCSSPFYFESAEKRGNRPASSTALMEANLSITQPWQVVYCHLRFSYSD